MCAVPAREDPDCVEQGAARARLCSFSTRVPPTARRPPAPGAPRGAQTPRQVRTRCTNFSLSLAPVNLDPKKLLDSQGKRKRLVGDGVARTPAAGGVHCSGIALTVQIRREIVFLGRAVAAPAHTRSRASSCAPSTGFIDFGADSRWSCCVVGGRRVAAPQFQRVLGLHTQHLLP